MWVGRKWFTSKLWGYPIFAEGFIYVFFPVKPAGSWIVLGLFWTVAICDWHLGNQQDIYWLFHEKRRTVTCDTEMNFSGDSTGVWIGQDMFFSCLPGTTVLCSVWLSDERPNGWLCFIFGRMMGTWFWTQLNADLYSFHLIFSYFFYGIWSVSQEYVLSNMI